MNASLNGLAFLLLLSGYAAIRRGRVETHRWLMQAAFATSILFLISYLVYHAQAGSKRFPGTGEVRVLYFAILISHTLLAAVVPFGVIALLIRAYQGRFAEHRRLARRVFPAWVYVSFTGVVIYWMLYRIQWPT